jgi:hypothetical protein
VIIAFLSISLNMLRDCKIEQEEYRMSSLVINHVSLALILVITLLNVLMSAIGYVGPPIQLHAGNASSPVIG